MESLSGLLAFVRAAELRSFVAAGERLGVSASAIGKSIARLEESLGVRLFNRSTRRINLTDEGALFFERCQRIVSEIENAQAEMARISDAPRGRLRVSMPAIGYRMLVPLLAEFRARYPEVELNVDFNDRIVDLIAEGIDVAVRGGELADSRLMVRRIGPFRQVLVGAPDYFRRRGTPLTPMDLLDHDCLRYRFPSGQQLQAWLLQTGDDALQLRLPVTMSFNSVEGLIHAAQEGLGIAYLPDFSLGPALQAGRLTAVLENHTPEQGFFSAVWPSNRHMLPKVRVFVDYLAQHMLPHRQ
ncbi:D-malate degradation protein R [Serratia entomophila]|uniref:LysR family transcriptional regulator n=1 Tax=Serratia entomophila TaxID=42906 RepID=UPI00217B89B1|nr:LysR family transcriptional regulator [Serratia entomophila]CAI1133743.1 D-malate degradation protein R [Serratia entomophila]CAI1924571.1 D-malate degradation protein R [Serratia entomophila]CAI1953566.1 D-malate degradation protein R [Serratia entomophila]CAI1989412.1 D-malate degradation protein R [Serratia entomophila]CAI2108535.1 D-malate degradation protein R [Serratia entomophila]